MKGSALMKKLPNKLLERATETTNYQKSSLSSSRYNTKTDKRFQSIKSATYRATIPTVRDSTSNTFDVNEITAMVSNQAN